MKKMEELLEKYFDGATSCEEERILRHFFTTEQVPPQWEAYRPLFAYLDKEIQELRHSEDVVRTHRRFGWRPSLRQTVSIAAGILLCIGITRFLSISGETENFVVIDRKRYTDPTMVQAKAREALLNVSFTDEELNQLLFPIEP